LQGSRNWQNCSALVTTTTEEVAFGSIHYRLMTYMYLLDRNASSIPGPYYNIGPFSIQTLSIILFNIIFVTSGVILRPSRVSFTNIFLGFASKKYHQTDSRVPKCLPRVTKNSDVYNYIRNCWTEILARSLGHIIISIGPFSIQTLCIILFNTIFVTSGVILRPLSQFY
jgi:hypothetical protein